MSESVYEKIERDARYLNLDLTEQDIARFSEDGELSQENIEAIAKIFKFLRDRKSDKNATTLLRLSRLPLREPKTFDNFDFSLLHGKDVAAIKNLPTLSAVYARQNLAFIGPQGVGKTHLAMAYGRECCKQGMKTYFLKATELNQKLTDARKYGRENSTVVSLVKPACLIIDEVGRCTFDKENTRMFFDIIDRRYNKEVPNTMIFTSNLSPNKWGEFFSEDSSLLCALDRIFDDATVFMIKGESYRGKKCETVALTTGEALPIVNH